MQSVKFMFLVRGHGIFPVQHTPPVCTSTLCPKANFGFACPENIPARYSHFVIAASIGGTFPSCLMNPFAKVRWGGVRHV